MPTAACIKQVEGRMRQEKSDEIRMRGSQIEVKRV